MLLDLLFIYQQEQYDVKRFLRFCYTHISWWGLQKRQKLDFTKKILLITFLYIMGGVFCISLAALFLGWWVLLFVLFWYLLTPVLIVLISWIIYPVERFLKKRIVAQARAILDEKRPIIIGITGSYGKTSMKEILKDVLEGMGSSVISTPGNVNTTMGIAQYIIDNKTLVQDVDYLVIEMGAFKIGNIKETASLVSPEYSFLTAVGEVHLDRFGSLVHIMKAKVELAEETSIKTYVNGSVVLAEEAIRQSSVKNYELVTREQLGEVTYLDNYEGMSFTISGKKYTSKMLADHNLDFVLMTHRFLVDLGIDGEQLGDAISNTKQFSHRIEPTYNSSTNVWVLDDSYNGNESGFMSALGVLDRAPGRKIVLTPGIVELAQKTKEVHERLAKAYMDRVDLVLLIDSEGSRHMKQYFKDRDFSHYKYFKSAPQAHSQLGSIITSGDTVLFSNDLSDNYT